MPALGLGPSVAVPGKPLGVDGGVNAGVRGGKTGARGAEGLNLECGGQCSTQPVAFVCWTCNRRMTPPLVCPGSDPSVVGAP